MAERQRGAETTIQGRMVQGRRSHPCWERCPSLGLLGDPPLFWSGLCATSSLSGYCEKSHRAWQYDECEHSLRRNTAPRGGGITQNAPIGAFLACKGREQSPRCSRLAARILCRCLTGCRDVALAPISHSIRLTMHGADHGVSVVSAVCPDPSAPGCSTEYSTSVLHMNAGTCQRQR